MQAAVAGLETGIVQRAAATGARPAATSTAFPASRPSNATSPGRCDRRRCERRYGRGRRDRAGFRSGSCRSARKPRSRWRGRSAAPRAPVAAVTVSGDAASRRGGGRWLLRLQCARRLYAVVGCGDRGLAGIGRGGCAMGGRVEDRGRRGVARCVGLYGIDEAVFGLLLAGDRRRLGDAGNDFGWRGRCDSARRAGCGVLIARSGEAFLGDDRALRWRSGFRRDRRAGCRQRNAVRRSGVGGRALRVQDLGKSGVRIDFGAVAVLAALAAAAVDAAGVGAGGSRRRRRTGR